MERWRLKRDWERIVAGLELIIQYETEGLPNLPDRYSLENRGRLDAYQVGVAAFATTQKAASIQFIQDEIAQLERDIVSWGSDEFYKDYVPKFETQKVLLEQIILPYIENSDRDGWLP